MRHTNVPDEQYLAICTSTHSHLGSGRWVNMWLPADIVEALTPLKATRRLQEEHHSSRCELAAAESNEIGAIGFIGNLVLFTGILLTIFLLHVLLASGVEAYWLTKVKPPTRMPLPYVTPCLTSLY